MTASFEDNADDSPLFCLRCSFRPRGKPTRGAKFYNLRPEVLLRRRNATVLRLSVSGITNKDMCSSSCAVLGPPPLPCPLGLRSALQSQTRLRRSTPPLLNVITAIFRSGISWASLLISSVCKRREKLVGWRLPGIATLVSSSTVCLTLRSFHRSFCTLVV